MHQPWYRRGCMDEWFLNLPLAWMALVVFATVYLVAGGILCIVMAVAKGERMRACKGIAGNLLPSMGAIFGLLVAFIGAEVWADMDRAESAVYSEASAMRTILLMASAFPGETEVQIHKLVRRHIDETVFSEWPMMTKRSASLKIAPSALAENLQLVLSIVPNSSGQIVAQRGMVAAIEQALDARRQRIVLSRARVNWIKWISLFGQACCILIAIGLIHCDNRGAALIAMGIFSTGVAFCVLLIASYDEPFSGGISVKPDVLLQVRPD